MQRLQSQNQRFHGLIGKLKLDADEKKEIVLWASGGRVTSSKDLTAHEMQKACERLAGTYDSSLARMQAKARAIASDIGILYPDGDKLNYTALNSFIESKFKVKSLFQLSRDQLRDCITALERWRDGKTKKMINTSLPPF